MKRIILIFALFVLSLAPAWAQDYDFSAVCPSGQTLYYKISGGNATVTSPDFWGDYTGNLVIPSSVSYGGTTYTVTSIDVMAFGGCYDHLTSVTIPNTVTSIGDLAFSTCLGLTNVTIPNSVTSIGAFAFAHCYNLVNFTIPNSVTTIGDFAFFGVRNIIYHGSATGSPWNALGVNGYVEEPFIFSDATKTHLCGCLYSANSAVIPNSVTTIEDWAFFNCSLSSVTIPSSVTSIGEHAFDGCQLLGTIVCKSSTPPFAGGEGTFWSVNSSCPIFVPCGSTSAYLNAPGWDQFTNFIEDINYNISAVSADNAMGSVSVTQQPTCTLPAIIQATPADNYTFDHWSDGNTDNPRTLTLIQDTVLTAYFLSTDFIFEDAAHTRLLRYVGHDSVITIPSTVTTILERAFQDCTTLTSGTIPSSVTSIGDYVFDGCSNLTSISIPNSITSISWEAFRGCTSLADLTIPNSVTTIGGEAFVGCAFTNIVIPNSVTLLYGFAFSQCENLTDVTLSNSITTIMENTFTGCRSLRNITIPNSVTTIEHAAFYNCSSLTDITLPNSVERIGEYAFNYCGSLTNIILPTSLTYIDNAAFAYCESLNNVTIPNSVTSIGYEAFAYCSSLTSITIPNSVTSIKDGTFDYCSSLTSITIPSSVTTIGYEAFDHCSNLDTIVFESSIPPSISYSGYTEVDPAYVLKGVSANCKVFVPCGSAAAYRADSQWGRFAHIIESGSHAFSATSVAEAMGQVTITQQPSCSQSAIFEATPAADFSFIRWSDGNTDNPRTLTLSQDTALTAYFGLVEYVHDTVFVALYLRDSVIIHDCAGQLHDTIIVHEAVRDCHEQQLYIIANNDTMGACAGSGVFPLGAEVQIMAIPNRGFRFVSWSDGNTQNPRPIVLDRSISLTAIFEQE